MSCAPLSLLGGPGGTGCNGVCFLVNSNWDNRDVSVADMCDCQYF